MRIEFGNALSRIPTLDIITLILSIIAIFVAGLVGYLQSSQIRISSLLDLESQYFREIYSKYLLKKIPEALQQISFPEQKISGSESLQECLTNMRHDSAYYRWTNPEFYQKLKTSMSDLEDYVVNASNRTFDPELQTDFNANVQAKLNIIYSTITNSYHGKSLKQRRFHKTAKRNP